VGFTTESNHEERQIKKKKTNLIDHWGSVVGGLKGLMGGDMKGVPLSVLYRVEVHKPGKKRKKA